MIDFGIKADDLGANDIPALCGLREKGVLSCAKQGFPNSKTEAWKYSYFDKKNLNDLKLELPKEHCDCNKKCECNEPSCCVDVYHIKICAGHMHRHFDLPDGLIIKPLMEAVFDQDVKNFLNKSFEMDDFFFAALNTAYLEQGLFICVSKDFCADKPIFLDYVGADGIFRNIRNIVVLQSEAKAVLLENFQSSNNKKYFTNIVNEIYVGQNSSLQHYKKQSESPLAYHIALNSVKVKKNGYYRAFCSQKGGLLARNETFVRLLDIGASAKVDGVYNLQGSSISDITTNIRHLSAYTSSDQLVKGVLNENSRGVFQGQIHIAPDAIKTQGNQLHHALLLSNEARVDCKPELEIFADDVKCSHGAASGNLSAEQLFYLQSRGIELSQAKHILIDAYINEVYEQIADENIKDWLRA